MSRIIRRLDPDGVRRLLDLAAAEGWNPGDDAAAFHAADPNGFFGAFVDDELVAGIAAVAYDHGFGFIGLYLCAPHWRGQGHGRAVWDAGMNYLGSRTIGLDAVPEQEANYAAMGFVGVYQTVRMSGTLAGPSVQEAITHHWTNASICELDRRRFPADRQAFLDHWLSSPNQVAALFQDGQAIGYAVGRKCRDGQKIGPIMAPSLDHAVALLGRYSGRVHIDVPALQVTWLDYLKGLGFTAGFSTRRMYRGPVPNLEMSEIFGITSLELG